MAIFLVSCTTACKKKFDWQPRPYVGDSINQELINKDGAVIKCDQPEFDMMTCFDSKNIAELKTAIGQVKNKKLKRKLLQKVNSLRTK